MKISVLSIIFTFKLGKTLAIFPHCVHSFPSERHHPSSPFTQTNTPTMKKITTLLAAGIAAISLQSASAALNSWVNWTGAPGSYNLTMSTGASNLNYANSASGTLFDPNTNSTINVTYSGEVYSLSEFNNTNGTNWFANTGTYLNSVVSTLPPRGNFIAVTGYSGLTNTLTFSSPVTNLLMSIGSLGNTGTQGRLVFNRNAVVVSSGQGLYGNGPLTMSNSTTLVGNEGNGIVQFEGTWSSLSWTIPNDEQYMVYNIGISNASASAAAVPEPGQVAASLLLLSGIGGYVFLKRRKAAQTAAPLAA